MKLTFVLAAFLAVFADDGLAAQGGPIPAEAGARTFRLGDIRITALRDAFNIVPNDGKIFGVGVGPEAVADVLTAAGAPADRVTLAVDALLVRSKGHDVLIDTGLGPAVHGALLASLAKEGVKPDDITTILITHVHGDHIGGLVTDAGVPAFPNAAIKISAPDWKWLQTQADMVELVKTIAPQVKEFTPGDVVSPGITSVAIKGHTPGHVGYEIRSGGNRLLDIGDAAHSSIVSLAEPEWQMGYDNDEKNGEASRTALMGQLASSHELIFAPHFPFPGVGHIVTKGNHFVWQPQN